MTTTPPVTDFELRTARAYIDSLQFYRFTSPPVSAPGGPATPAYYANRLGKILNARGDELPGRKTQWWGYRWAEYARHLIGLSDQLVEVTGADVRPGDVAVGAHTGTEHRVVSTKASLIPDLVVVEWVVGGRVERAYLRATAPVTIRPRD